jgi:hypothetical protein
MLQVYVPNVSSTSDVCCIQLFHVASDSYFRGMFRESWGMLIVLNVNYRPWPDVGIINAHSSYP